MMRAQTLVLLGLLAGCAAPGGSATGERLAGAIDSMRCASSYVVNYEMEISEADRPPARITGRAEVHLNGILKLTREAGGRRQRILRVGKRTWRADDEVKKWEEVPVSEAPLSRFEDPCTLLEMIREGAGSARGSDTEADLTLRIQSNLPVPARAEWDGRGLRRVVLESRTIRASYVVESVDTAGRMAIDDVAVPWSPEMKASAAKTMGER